jgi:pSer/pThr/pTyr-binding forkhead associated (FHA) protein
VIDNLAVSGEHALLQMAGNQVYLEDLNSTNGTYINGKAVKKQLLQSGDNIEVGKYQIKFFGDAEKPGHEKVAVVKAPPVESAPSYAPQENSSFNTMPAELDPVQAAIRVLSGVAAGREVALTKIVTTIGKPGIAIAAITRRENGFVIHHVEGADIPVLNGNLIGAEPINLKNGDLIGLAGTQMQFVES